MNAIDETHDPARQCWVESAAGHPEFPIQNLPLGIFSFGAESARGGIAIGDYVLDLKELGRSGLLHGRAQVAAEAASGTSLNKLFDLDPDAPLALRRAVSELLSKGTSHSRIEQLLHPAPNVKMHLPMRIGDYTDFYVGIHHATNVGRLFRPDNPLLPNYKHLPIGYHGRASSVRVSGTELLRPSGQQKGPADAAPTFGPTRRLDYELELAIWIARGNSLGDVIPLPEAEGHVAGLSLLNDWSARDMQAWEYQPLGPFLAKNFLTSVSPWIITSHALAPFRIAQLSRPEGDPALLPYLSDPANQNTGALALELEVTITTEAMRNRGISGHRLSRGAAANMYWTIGQMVAHHTSNGCDLQTGDLLGSGTISAPDPIGFGSLLELSNGGADPIELTGGERRSFLEDGDEIIFSAHAHADGFVSIGFGTCVGRVIPARAR